MTELFLCPVCGGSGEVVVRPDRVMGTTYWNGETGDERIEPCTVCYYDPDALNFLRPGWWIFKEIEKI